MAWRRQAPRSSVERRCDSVPARSSNGARAGVLLAVTVEESDEGLGCLQSVAVFEEVGEIGVADIGEANEHGAVALVVRGLEQHTRKRGQQRRLLVQITHHDQHLGVSNVDPVAVMLPLAPHPTEPLLAYVQA